MARLPLEGLKVADFTWVAAGPITTKYLADHGATVVKVESHARIDVLRLAPPFPDGVAGLNRSGFFANYNSSKYSITLNLNRPEAVEVARRLVLWADVVAENFTPGSMKRWGLDYESLVGVRPDIIYLSSSMQGRTGPHSRHPGYGNNAVSLAGFTHMTGRPDRDGVMPYGAYTDFISPRFAVAALMAALEHRRRTGRGQRIDMSQTAAALQFLGPVLMDAAVNGAVYQRRGNMDPLACPHGAYPCAGKDRWCVIAVFNDHQWRSLREAMGGPPWAVRPEYATFMSHKTHEDALDELISKWTRDRSPDEVMELLQEKGVPSGVVHSSEGLYGDLQHKHRGHFVTIEHPEMGKHHYDGYSFKLSRTPGQLRSPAPLMGQHNELVLRDILGLDEEEIGGLAEVGALE